MIGIAGVVYWVEDAGDSGVLFRSAAWHKDGEFVGEFPSTSAAIAHLTPIRARYLLRQGLNDSNVNRQSVNWRKKKR